jgi:hypothetical protein
MSLKLYIITPTRAQVTNKRIVVKDISYNPTCFGALRHNRQSKYTKILSDKRLDGRTHLWLKDVTSISGLFVRYSTWYLEDNLCLWLFFPFCDKPSVTLIQKQVNNSSVYLLCIYSVYLHFWTECIMLRCTNFAASNVGVCPTDCGIRSQYSTVVRNHNSTDWRNGDVLYNIIDSEQEAIRRGR